MPCVWPRGCSPTPFTSSPPLSTPSLRLCHPLPFCIIPFACTSLLSHPLLRLCRSLPFTSTCLPRHHCLHSMPALPQRTLPCTLCMPHPRFNPRAQSRASLPSEGIDTVAYGLPHPFQFNYESHQIGPPHARGRGLLVSAVRESASVLMAPPAAGGRRLLRRVS